MPSSSAPRQRAIERRQAAERGVATQGDIDHLNAYARVANIALVVGAVGIGTGTVLWFLNDGGSKEEGTNISMRGGARSAGISVTSTF